MDTVTMHSGNIDSINDRNSSVRLVIIARVNESEI